MENLYALFGVHRGSSVDDINRARKLLARSLHPDRAQGSSYEMAKVNAAHAVLTDPVALKRYFIDLKSTHRECTKCEGKGYTVKSVKFMPVHTGCAACEGLGMVPKCP